METNMETIQSYREIARRLKSGGRVYRKTMVDETRCLNECLTGGAFLVICGGGHISYPLCSLAKMLDYHVVVIDDRKEFANAQRFEMADDVYCMDFESALETLDFPEHAFYVIVTRGHQKDYECLKSILRKKSGYIGMIGSRAKIARTFERLREDGFSEEEQKRVHAPVGLPIGAETPEEIAVSIAAEMIEEKSKKNNTEVPAEILDWLLEKNEEMFMLTIVSKKGSAPRKTGARMLVAKSGGMAGTIGGGAIEHAAYEKALELFRTEKEKVVEAYDLTTKEAVNIGMICGGYVEVLFERIGSL